MSPKGHFFVKIQTFVIWTTETLVQDDLPPKGSVREFNFTGEGNNSYVKAVMWHGRQGEDGMKAWSPFTRPWKYSDSSNRIIRKFCGVSVQFSDFLQCHKPKLALPQRPLLHTMFLTCRLKNPRSCWMLGLLWSCKQPTYMRRSKELKYKLIIMRKKSMFPSIIEPNLCNLSTVPWHLKTALIFIFMTSFPSFVEAPPLVKCFGLPLVKGLHNRVV